MIKRLYPSSQLSVTLGYWRPRTAWDRINADELFDGPEPEFISSVSTMSSIQPLRIEIGVGVRSNYIVTPVFVDLDKGRTQLSVRHTINGVLDGEQPVFTINRVRDPHAKPSFRLETPPAYKSGLSISVEFLDFRQGSIPHPRNGKERRILAALGEEKLFTMIKKAAKVIGENDQSHEWNHLFFDYLSRTRVKNEAVAHRRAK